MAARQKPLLSVREAGEILGVGTTTAYEWLRRGELPGAVQHGGRWYVRRAVLEAYLSGADVLGDPNLQPALMHPSGNGRGGRAGGGSR